MQQGFVQRTPRGRILTGRPMAIWAWPRRRAIHLRSDCFPTKDGT